MAGVTASATVRTIELDENSDIKEILRNDTLTLDSLKVKGYMSHKNLETVTWMTNRKLEYIDFKDCHFENNSIPKEGLNPTPYQASKEDYKYLTKLKCVLLPESLDRMEAWALCGCIRLERLELPKQMSYIGPLALSGLFNLKSIDVPEGITSIEMSCINNNRTMESVTLPSTLKTVKEYGLAGLTSLKKMYFNEGLESLGERACDGWLNCTEIVLPSTIKELGSEAIGSLGENCKLYIKAAVPPVVAADALGVRNEEKTLYVPVGAKAAYEAAPVWKDFKEIVEVSQFPSAGVEAVLSDGAADVRVYGTEGAAVIDGDGVGYAVYSADGLQVATGIADGKTEISLPSGLYIVLTGCRATKIAVK